MRRPLHLTLLTLLLPSAKSSRAHPYGCATRPPCYYTYDERDTGSFFGPDFRKLPNTSSGMTRPLERYRIGRRLGSGRFSNVYEAVDEGWIERRDRLACRGEDGTTDTDTETVDLDSLVVLKCLKPISERKIRRELLVLTHCASLPNMARLIGIVLPDYMGNSDDDNDDDLQHHSSSPIDHPKKQRRKHQIDDHDHINIGSITDNATANTELKNRDDPTPHEQITHQQTPHDDEPLLPAFILEHAGPRSKWFCHGPSDHNSTQQNDSFLSERDIKYYTCHLLIALDGLHSAGIMHRDIKPRNCLINTADTAIPRTPTDSSKWPPIPKLPHSPLMLVDLGLAEFYLPGKEYNVRVASRHYKSPELLLGYSRYDYAIDMWGVGCILAGLLFRKEPFFRGSDNEDQLGKIVGVLGIRDFLSYCRKVDGKLTPGMREAIGRNYSGDGGRRQPWLSFVSPTCPVPSSDALDLLDKCLVYDHDQRWTAGEALMHPFFDDVREDVGREVRMRLVWERRWRPRVMQWR